MGFVVKHRLDYCWQEVPLAHLIGSSSPLSSHSCMQAPPLVIHVTWIPGGLAVPFLLFMFSYQLGHLTYLNRRFTIHRYFIKKSCFTTHHPSRRTRCFLQSSLVRHRFSDSSVGQPRVSSAPPELSIWSSWSTSASDRTSRQRPRCPGM
jgi:hypothetical protein